MAGPDRGYYHAMDRDYTQEPLLPIPQIGVSIMATRDAIQPLVAKIREGASKVEIGFMGAGKGSIFSGQITPEGVSAEQRQAIREIAKVNKVELSTHASVSTGGFAGLTNRGFDETTRETNIQELKRAIDFAADTAQGGAITVHMDEFPRPLFSINPEEDAKFRAYPEEEKRAMLYLVDERTGDIITSVRKDIPIQTPRWQKNPDGSDKLDRFNQKIPEYDKDGRFKIDTLEWKDIEEKTAKLNALNPKQKVLPEEVWYREQIEAKKLQAAGQRLYHIQGYEQQIKEEQRLEKALKEWQEMEAAAGPDKQKYAEKFAQKLGGELAQLGLAEDREKMLPSAFIEQRLKEVQHRLAQMRISAVAYQEQEEDYDKALKSIKPLGEYAKAKTAESLGRAGLYTWHQEREKGLNKDGRKPLFIAPENLFAEKYGSHPDELKEIIQSSRKAMVTMLQKENPAMTEDRAKSIAQDHIKATMDIGHLNTWRKYFDAKPGESSEDQTKRFHTWMLDKIKDLNANKIIGHVHVTDNFGYHDEHLTPGQGNAPIYEFVKLMKEAGVTDLVVEPGAQDPAKQYEAMYGGWKMFGHSIYGISAPGKHADWGHVENAYMGKNHSPYFLFGELALSDEYRGAPFWSGLGLE